MIKLLEIIFLTLFVTVISTMVSSLIGIPFGYLLMWRRTKLKKIMQSIVTALTGFPPVVAGLCVYFLLTRYGPLGTFKLLYSPTAMILAQILIITPIISALIFPAFLKVDNQMSETFKGLRLGRKKIFRLLIVECKTPIITAVMTGFGRGISEVGAVMMVGGNIEGKTRVMTTAIMTKTSQGEYEGAIILGVILLAISIVINILVGRQRT